MQEIYSRIIYPLEGTNVHWGALDRALVLARHLDLDLELFHVEDPMKGPAIGFNDEHVAEIKRRANELEITLLWEVERGDPVGIFSELAAEDDHLIVMGTDMEKTLFTSFHEQIQHRARCPIIVQTDNWQVRPKQWEEELRQRQRGFRILVAVDGSELSNAALVAAFNFAAATDGMIHAISIAMSDKEVGALKHKGIGELLAQLINLTRIEATWEIVRSESIENEILYEMESNYDLLVVATMGGTGLREKWLKMRKLLLGSASARLLELCPKPVLVTSPH